MYTNTEYLKYISVELAKTQGVEIYVNPTGDLSVAGLTPVVSLTGSNALESGYHRIKLDTPIELTNNKFAIIIKYISRSMIIMKDLGFIYGIEE